MMDLKILMDSKLTFAAAGFAAGVAAGMACLYLKPTKSATASQLTPWKGNFCTMRRQDLPVDGRKLFSAWLAEAEAVEGVSARVMVVATSTAGDGATARSVICHKMNENGSIIFGTNSQSQKLRALRADPRCELLFRWGDRQIRIRGKAEIGDAQESDAAFGRLPRHCQLGLQFLVQGSRIDEKQHQDSIAAYGTQVAKLGLDADGPRVPRPANYTAVIVQPDSLEFYQGGQPGYINDRFIFVRSAGKFPLAGRLQS